MTSSTERLFSENTPDINPKADQINRRRKRALDEIKAVKNYGDHSIFSTFAVTSVSDQTYTVQIRSCEQFLNSCSCPDYRTNTLGTCKHIEGVLLYLKHKLGTSFDELSRSPGEIYEIFLQHASQIRVATPSAAPSTSLKALFARSFDAQGVLLGTPTKSLPILLKELTTLQEEAYVHVHEDVFRYLEQCQELEGIAVQKGWFLDQVAQGNWSLDPLSVELYPFQREGLLQLAFTRRMLLADDMGLGKTVQAIAAASLLNQLRGIKRVLIICPASLKHQWAREINRFTTFPTAVIQGGKKNRQQLYRSSTFFYIANYELVRQDLKDITRMVPDLVILDEAQRIKNWRTKTADMVKQIPSNYAFVLTGTPLENKLDELYSIFQFIDPSIFGPLWRFNQRYYDGFWRPSGSFKVTGYKNLDELRRRITPFVLRRTRAEVFNDLPERTDNNFFVEITKAQREPYSEFEATVARLLSVSERRELNPSEQQILLSSLVKMRMLCDALVLHDKAISQDQARRTAPKIKELGLILTDEVLDTGRKAIIFSQWIGMLALVEPILFSLGLGFVKLSGGVPSAKRGDLIRQFDENKDCQVFLSTDAGGVGLNLQAANLVINLDLPWNPAVLEQRIARAHRHGQRCGVQVINLIAKDTIEERMLDTLASKRRVFESIFGGEDEEREISLENSSSILRQQLNELLIDPAVKRVDLEDDSVTKGASTGVQDSSRPKVAVFSERLLELFPGRILLVCRGPQLSDSLKEDTILLVVEDNPLSIRTEAEELLGEIFAELAPTLCLLEREGYQTLNVLTGGFEIGDEAYRSSNLDNN